MQEYLFLTASILFIQNILTKINITNIIDLLLLVYDDTASAALHFVDGKDCTKLQTVEALGWTTI